MTTTTRAPRLELWVEARDGRPAVNPVIAVLLQSLADSGRPVSVRVPEQDQLGQVRGPRPDLVLLKTATTLAVSLAVAGEAAGGRFLNSAAATSAANDKAAVLARLSFAGVPVPLSYLIDPQGRSGEGRSGEGRSGGQDEADEAGEADGRDDPRGGWVSKPVFGWHGVGVQFHPRLRDALVAGATAQSEAGWLVDDGSRLVQRQVGAGEPDLKVYVAGEHTFSTSKAFTAKSFTSDDVRPVELDGTSRDIVRAAGETLGLRLFGVDLRFDAGMPVVIDVNPFPGFRGFPDAVPALMAEIDRAWVQVR